MSTTYKTLPPPATIGILGGGQLGRMFAMAARRMGYRVHTLDPQPNSPAGQVCDKQIVAAYDDLAAVRELASGVDVVTFEFENVPLAAAETAAQYCPVRPEGRILHICQNREREKLFLSENGFPCTDFRIIASAADLAAALAAIPAPAVLKTADFGYDGKGQMRIGDQKVEHLWQDFGVKRAVLERWITHTAELSVIVARALDGSVAAFPAVENRHRNHILHTTIAPGKFPAALTRDAETLAIAITEKLDVVGLLVVELFLTSDGKLLVNELAPRPHNSGHWTIEAAATSQFEQHVRAICGLPLGPTRPLCPAVMLNILGDAWGDTNEPDWVGLLRDYSDAKLHLYGKTDPRKGRKMGHVTFLDTTEAVEWPL